LSKLNQSLLTDLDFKYEVAPLLPLLDKVIWDETNRCDLNKPIGHRLYDPYEIRKEWQGSLFETLLNSIPLPIGEARLMKLTPGTCYCSHSDIDDRYHLNLVSNDQTYLIDLDHQKMHRIVCDNKLYYMDGSRLHTAVNFGSTDRIQLVIRVPLVRYTGTNFVNYTIKFNRPSFNFRYIFDKEISNFLNLAVKDKTLGYFDMPAANKIEVSIDRKVFEILRIKLDNIDKDYTIL